VAHMLTQEAAAWVVIGAIVIFVTNGQHCNGVKT